MKNNAYQYITHPYTHPRPPADFGNLSGPEGNAFMVLANCSQILKRRGYEGEFNEINYMLIYLLPDYDKSFDKINFYLNLAPAPEPIDLQSLMKTLPEDNGEEIVFKISKKDLTAREDEIYEYEESYHIQNLWNSKKLKELVAKKNLNLYEIEDANNLGRHALFYVKNLEDFKKLESSLLAQGETKQGIEQLLATPDLANMRAIDSLLLTTNKEAVELGSTVELALYYAHNYPKAFALKELSNFGANTLSPLLHLGQGFERILSKENYSDAALKLLLNFELLASEVGKMPHFKKAVEHNKEILNLTNKKENSFLMKCADIRAMIKNSSYLSQKVSARYAALIANFEKEILSNSIADNPYEKSPAFKV